MVTPVSPPSLLMLILSSIFASVAATPSASSFPFPLSANTLGVVPPVIPSIGVELKSSSNARIVGCEPQSSIVAGITHSKTFPVPDVRPPVLPLVMCPTKQIEPPPALLKNVVA